MEGTRRRPSLPQGRRYRDCRRPGVRGGRVLEVQERLVSSPPGRGSSHPSAPATRGRRGGITKAGNRHFGRALAESARLYVSASANSKELSKGQLPDPAARRHGFSALSLSMSSPWSSGAARAALMLRKPTNCNLRSMWSDSPLGLQLGNLAMQGIGSFSFLGRIRHLSLKCRDALVAFGDGLPQSAPPTCGCSSCDCCCPRTSWLATFPGSLRHGYHQPCQPAFL